MQMNMHLGQRMEQRQQMILAPRMIQSMEILQLPIMALQERIQQELQDNPVLEQRDTAEGAPAVQGEDFNPAAPAPGDETRARGAGELVIEDSGSNELDFDRLEAMS